MEEVWKDIPNRFGYKVSNLGNIKSLNRSIIRRSGHIQSFKERILKKTLGVHGYYVSNVAGRSYPIHYLMAISFLNHNPKGTSKLVCDHIDGNKLNNNLNNLQLISNRENCSKNRKSILNTTGVKKNGKGFLARIYFKNKHYHLGTFKTIEAASSCYQFNKRLIENNCFNL